MGTQHYQYWAAALVGLSAGVACDRSSNEGNATPATSATMAPASSVDDQTAEAAEAAEGTSQHPSAGAMLGSVYVDLVDWRTGGRALFLRPDGSGVLRVIGNREGNVQNEKRYQLPPSPARRESFERVLLQHRATTMKVDAEMAPGDQSATVSMRPSTGEEIVLQAPASRSVTFQRLLSALEPLLNGIDTSALEANYDGRAAPNWEPPPR